MSILLILCIPVALTYTFGKMVFSVRQGVAILAVMAVLFGGWLTMATVAEHQGNPAMAAAGVSDTNVGNMEGKETRFGVPSSSLYNVTSTQTSTGSVDSAADSYTPIGGFAMLTGMMLGEVSPGGVGTGLYSMLLFAVITVFIGGLMVGRPAPASSLSRAPTAAPVSQSRREEIFGLFLRREADTGTGLGLAIAKTFLDAHGQRIWVDNVPGGGAALCFTLPIATDLSEEH